MKHHHHVCCCTTATLLLALFALLGLTASAETPDSLLQQEKVQIVAESLIKHYEALRLKEERQFSTEGIQPLTRGIIMSFTEKGYRDIPASFAAKEDKVDIIDYVPAAAPLATAWILRAAGVESRSSLRRMAIANGLSLALAGGITLGLNHLIDEMSPDQSSAHALPSGHAALAFASATILSREYGYHSPWITVGSYACATTSQLLRLHHNRHWVNDLFLGAGVGTVSTNLAYFITDQILGKEDVNRIQLRKSDLLRTIRFIDNPTGLKLISGTEVGNRRASLFSNSSTAEGNSAEQSEAQIITSATFMTGFALNCYLNPNFSIDAILRAGTSTAKVQTLDGQPIAAATQPGIAYSGERLDIYHADLAAHFSMPVRSTARIGVRALAGVRHTTSCTFSPTSLDQEPVTPIAESALPTFCLPSQTRFELGGGLDIELLSSRNYMIGFTGDYYHTFNALFRNRYSICSFWKLLF